MKVWIYYDIEGWWSVSDKPRSSYWTEVEITEADWQAWQQLQNTMEVWDKQLSRLEKAAKEKKILDQFSGPQWPEERGEESYTF